MNKRQRWLSLTLCLCLFLSAIAFAELEEQTPAEEGEVIGAYVISADELLDDMVVAVVNGIDITWANVKGNFNDLVNDQGSYYDMMDPVNITLFRAVALKYAIDKELLLQQAAAAGFFKLPEEELVQILEMADDDWDAAIENFILGNFNIDIQQVGPFDPEYIAVAEAFYGDMGYTREILRELYVQDAIISLLYQAITQDAVVTDEELEADYQARVAADRELFEFDIAAYINYNGYVDQMAMYAMFYGGVNDVEYAWYKPAGFRAVKHILLPVDDELMANYKDLQSRLEEQLDSEGGVYLEEALPVLQEQNAGDLAPSPEPPRESVTQEDVDGAKAEILRSLADKIDAIYQLLEEGVSFDELIDTYGVLADGSPSDPGMHMDPFQVEGYEVAAQSYEYVPEFVEAAFSIENIGDVSAPYLSDYGVHIVKYIADVPAGPIPMTAEQRESKRISMLDAKRADLFSDSMEEWSRTAEIVYTGLIPSFAELIAREAALYGVDD